MKTIAEMIEGYPLEMIRWVDSARYNGWTKLEGYALSDESLNCVSIGFIIAESDAAVTIAAHLSACGNADGLMEIPQRAILSRKRMEKPCNGNR